MINEHGRDLSQQSGNPTNAIQNAYAQLMAIQDPAQLMQAAIDVVRPLVGKGMSEQNYSKFMAQLKQSAQRGLTSIQMFLSNYLLAGSNLAVGRAGGRGVAEAIENIANMITEDVNVFRELTAHQVRLKRLVESNTKFKVVLL